MRILLSRAIRPLARRVRGLRALAASKEGVAAVEFAMVLPVMVLMYLGMTELTFAVNTDRKITLLSRTLADLTGRATTKLGTAEFDAIFNAALAVMSPYKSDQTAMRLSSIVVKKVGGTDQNPVLKGTVCWSEARGPGIAKLSRGAEVVVPEGFRTASTSYIRAEVKMPYAPVFGSGILQMVTGTSGFALDEETPWPVRNVAEVESKTEAKCLP